MTRSVTQPPTAPARPPAGISPQPHPARARLERVGEFLDSGIRLPGLGWRIGWEAVLGLIPGIGDLIGLACGAWLMLEAWRLSAPPRLLLRMAGNVLLDALVGLVPLLGDLFDFAFKSNRRNLRLLGAHLDRLEGRAPPSRRSATALRMLGLLALAGLAGYGLYRLGG